MRVLPDEHEKVTNKKWQQLGHFTVALLSGVEWKPPETIFVLATVTFRNRPSDNAFTNCDFSPPPFQVDSKDSSRNSTNSEFAAEAEGQNDTNEEPNKVQKRKRDRLRDQGSTVIYLKAIQGILGKSMPKRKGEAATRATPTKGERPSRGEGPARSVTVSPPQKGKESAPEVRAEDEKPAPERSSFCDRRVVIDPQERPSEETAGDRRTVIDKHSPALEFLDDSDSHLESQKVSRAYTKHGVFNSLTAMYLVFLV